jgi:thiamine kinase-like enzyme
MARASGERPLNDALSRGEQPQAFFEQLPIVLARLNESTFGRFAPDTVYGNTTFRDFKLKIQYDDVAARLESAEAAIVMACKESYQRDASCVLHGDINSRNILVGPGALGVIDFEQSHLGSPAYDLAYILCELFISLENFGGEGASHAPIRMFLDRYFSRFCALARGEVETLMTKHLAVQAIYRFWGPSGASWTFYVDEPNRERLIRAARSLLFRDGPLSEVLA